MNILLSTLQQLTDDPLFFKTQKDGSFRVGIKKLSNGKKTYGTRLVRALNSQDKTIYLDLKNTSKHFKDKYNKTNISKPVNKKNAQNGIGSDSYISFDPDFMPESGPRPPCVGLAHEMIHTLHNAEGSADYETKEKRSNIDVCINEENRTVGISNEVDEPTENRIRQEQGVGLREKY